MVELLFVGGPSDGKTHLVSVRQFNYGFVEMPDFPKVPIDRPDLLPDSVQVVRYRILKLNMSSKERCFVAVAESIKNPLEHLIKGYKPT